MKSDPPKASAGDAPPPPAGQQAPMPRETHLLVGLALPGVLLCVCMWRLRAYTVDDAYISFRYAKHLAAGMGLVFNEGERIEGYTNFLFTCLLALAIKIGLDPDKTAKVIGALSALGSLACTYGISARLSPLRAVPVLATWLLAGSVATAGYAVFGLETSFFVFSLLLATWCMLRERDEPGLFPWSGAALAVAGLTRPEAPMFAFLLMLFLVSKPAERGAKSSALRSLSALVERRNLLRAALFVLPVAAHLAFRRAYYGAWLPNTFAAKTGNLDQQIQGGLVYLRRYIAHTAYFLDDRQGVVPTAPFAPDQGRDRALTPLAVILFAALPLWGAWRALVERRRDLGAMAVVSLSVLVYVLLVGGDWMPYFRFLAAFEPFWFLLLDVAVREAVQTKGRAVRLALGALAVYTAWARGRAFSDAARAVDEERRFWTSAAGGVADWFAQHGERGTIAVADMGYISYATDYPLLDLLGLVDPVISKLPGGYTNKTGPGYVARVFDVHPRYFVFVGGAVDCERLPFPQQARLKSDPRFRSSYTLAGQVRHSKNGYWCIFGERP